MKTSQTEKNLPRRGFLKLGVASALALMVSRFIHPGKVEAATTYYGTDSLTQSCCGMPQNFYIGKTGQGLSMSTTYFNTSAALAAGNNKTHSYWFLLGPNSPTKPSGDTPYAWGQRQATKACDAWFDHPYAGFFSGKTIFGDIEQPSSYGWTGTLTQNRDVLRG